MRIYVSSTFDDLRECRQVVHDMLRRMRQDDVAMEHYVAEPERPLDVCRRDVRECDLFVGIYAWRYGFVPDGEHASITELEYREAVAAGKPCLVFVLDEDAPWPRSSMERGPGAERIDALRAELTAAHTVTSFSGPDELAGLVAAAVSRHVARTDGGAGRALGIEAFGAYHDRLRQQYGRLDLEALTPPEREQYLQIQLESVFVEQNVRENPPPVELPRDLVQRLLADGDVAPDELPGGMDAEDVRRAWDAYRTTPARPVLAAVTRGERCCVVLGDPGAGKSTLARYLVLSSTGALPLLVELRRYVAARERNVCTTLLGFAGHLGESQGCGPDGAGLESYLTGGGPALAVFDGLDEIFDPVLREETAHEIAGFAARFPSARVVVTSRIVGYRRGPLTGAGFAHFTLQDLDEGQISAFLRSWYRLALHDRPESAEESRGRLLQAVRDSRSIAELAGNPLLLTILAIIGKNQTLPRERWKVYDHAARVLVQHWDVNRGLRERDVASEYIDEDDKREMLRRLAWRMQNGSSGSRAGNLVHRDELREVFESYLVERYARDPADAKTVATAMIDQFRTRNFILSRFGPELFGFVHRAFLEFFCADAVVQRFQRHRSLSPEELVELFAAHRADPAWREVLRLLASVLSEAHVGLVIDHLLTLDRPWPTPPEARVPHGLPLAVQCLAEVRTIRDLAEQAERVLNEVLLYLEHCAGTFDRETGPDAVDVMGAEILPAARLIGDAWPGRDRLARWFRDRGCRLVWYPATEQAAVLTARLLPDRVDVLLRLRCLLSAADARASDAVGFALDELRDLPVADVVADRAVRVELEETLADEDWMERDLAVVLLDRAAPRDAAVDDSLLRVVTADDHPGVVLTAAEILLRRRPGEPVLCTAVAARVPPRATSGDRWAPVHRSERRWMELLTRHLPEAEVTRRRLLLQEIRALDPGDDGDLAPVLARLAAEPDGLDRLLAALRDEPTEGTGRVAAVLLADRMAPADPRAEAAFREAWLVERDDGVLVALADALLRRAPEPDVVEHALEHVRGPLARASLDVLAARSRPDDSRVAALRLRTELAGDPLPEIDEPLAARIRDVPGHRAVLFDLSRDDDYRLRHNALLALGRLGPGDEEVENRLREAVREDPIDDVVDGAARTLLERLPGDSGVLDTVAERGCAEPGFPLADKALALLEQYAPGHPQIGAVREAAGGVFRVAADRRVPPVSSAPPEFWETGLSTEREADDLAARLSAGRSPHDLLDSAVTSNNVLARRNVVLLRDRIDPPGDRGLRRLLLRLLEDDTDEDVLRAAAYVLFRRHPADAEGLAVLRDRVAARVGDGTGIAATETLAAHTTGSPIGDGTVPYGGFSWRALLRSRTVSVDDLPVLDRPVWFRPRPVFPETSP